MKGGFEMAHSFWRLQAKFFLFRKNTTEHGSVRTCQSVKAQKYRQNVSTYKGWTINYANQLRISENLIMSLYASVVCCPLQHRVRWAYTELFSSFLLFCWFVWVFFGLNFFQLLKDFQSPIYDGFWALVCGGCLRSLFMLSCKRSIAINQRLINSLSFPRRQMHLTFLVF